MFTCKRRTQYQGSRSRRLRKDSKICGWRGSSAPCFWCCCCSHGWWHLQSDWSVVSSSFLVSRRARFCEWTNIRQAGALRCGTRGNTYPHTPARHLWILPDSGRPGCRRSGHNEHSHHSEARSNRAGLIRGEETKCRNPNKKEACCVYLFTIM